MDDLRERVAKALWAKTGGRNATLPAPWDAATRDEQREAYHLADAVLAAIDVAGREAKAREGGRREAAEAIAGELERAAILAPANDWGDSMYDTAMADALRGAAAIARKHGSAQEPSFHRPPTAVEPRTGAVGTSGGPRDAGEPLGPLRAMEAEA